MPDEKKPIDEGYQPVKKGYQPNQGNLDPLNPPQGGSGVPASDTSDSGSSTDSSAQDSSEE